ncbi:MAG: alanine racemase [Kofleriaceae bacterium]|nr:alanine racemase [Kofleriaceae bacterium]
MIRRTRVEVDLGAIVENAGAINALTGTNVYAVVKADGYGHGAIVVARALEAKRAVAGFAVSLVEEAVVLRDAGIVAPILVMGPSQLGGEDELLGLALTPVVSDAEEIAALAGLARRRNVAVDVHLKIDTGMGRLGVLPADAIALAVTAQRQGVRIVGLMTHFANADSDSPDDPMSSTMCQLASFAEVHTQLQQAGIAVKICHAANSSGAMMFPTARMDAVRTGLALYGNGHWSSDAQLKRPRRQAMRLVTEVAQLRTVAAGSCVGYGGLWRATRDSRVAVLPVGYADGLPKRAIGAFCVIIGGVRCPLVGAVSMDIAIADVSDAPGVRSGDSAVLLGRDANGDQISTAQFAEWTGLTEYEVTCGMSKRVPRTYIGGDL